MVSLEPVGMAKMVRLIKLKKFYTLLLLLLLLLKRVRFLLLLICRLFKTKSAKVLKWVRSCLWLSGGCKISKFLEGRLRRLYTLWNGISLRLNRRFGELVLKVSKIIPLNVFWLKVSIRTVHLAWWIFFLWPYAF